MERGASATGNIGFQHHLSYKFYNCLPERRLSGNRSLPNVSEQTHEVISGKSIKQEKPSGIKTDYKSKDRIILNWPEKILNTHE